MAVLHTHLIELHKTQLASDRMSCHSATANQVRLVFHTGAFWLMHGVRAALPLEGIKNEYSPGRRQYIIQMDESGMAPRVNNAISSPSMTVSPPSSLRDQDWRYGDTNGNLRGG